MKTNKTKELLLEQLKKTPIVQLACDKSGISRATFYRWKKQDPEFAQKADDALQEGSLLINDMAESQLMSAIRDKNMTAIIFWLKHHHAAYTTKVEIMTSLKDQKDILNEEQQELLTKALTMAKLLPDQLEGKKDE